MTFLTPARFLAPAAALLLAAGLAAAPAAADDDPPTATGSVSGHVTDAATGAPLEHIEVGLVNVDDSMNSHGGQFTDADGAFRFDAVEAATWILYVNDHDGRYVSANSGNFTVADGEQVTGKDFRLVVGATITGVAVDDRTGLPDFDRNICATVYKGRTDDFVGGESDCAGWDDDGRWYVRGLPAGRYTVKVGGDSKLTARWAPAAATQAGAAVYPVTGGQTLDLGTQRLRPGGTVTGRVTNQAGAPVEGVNISLSGPCEPICDMGAQTDADGRYRIDNLDAGPGWYLRFTVYGEPYAGQFSGGALDPAGARRFRAGFETTTTVDAVLRPEAKLNVTVSGTRPGYYTSVAAYTPAGTYVGSGGHLTQPGTGTATLRNLPAGRVKIEVFTSDEYDTDRTTVWYGGTSPETATPVRVTPERTPTITVALPG